MAQGINKGPSSLLFNNELWLLRRMAETLDPVNKQISRVCAIAHNGSLYLNIEASKNEGECRDL